MDGRGGRGGTREGWRIGLLLVLALQGCAVRTPAGGPGPDAGCILDPGGSREWEGREVPVVGITDPVDPARAPLGGSDGEVLLFATLHPPLLRLDCGGSLGPGLVRAWRSPDSGLTWVLSVEAPGMGAAEVGRLGRSVAARLRHPEAWSGGEGPLSVEWRPPGEVVVGFAHPPADGAAVFALPGLVPLPEAPEAGAPRAGGPGAPNGWGAGFSGLALERVPVQPRERGGMLRLHRAEEGSTVAHIRVVPGGDPRDLVDEGAALVLTRDPVAVAWGRGRAGVRVVPLPPDRVHLLVLPRGGVGALPAGFREALTRDVIPGSSPGDPRGWLPDAVCPAPGGAAAHGIPSASSAFAPAGGVALPSPGRIVVRADDPVARALAERVAALSGPGGDPAFRMLGVPGEKAGAVRDGPLRVEDLPPGAFESALWAGGEAAYILALPRGTAAPCRAREELGARVPWLQAGGTLLSLVETGLTALAREGAPRLEVDGTGRVRLLPRGSP